MPTVGKGRSLLDDDRRSPEPAPARAEPEPEPARPSRRGTGGNAVTTDRASAYDDDRERVESVPHVVQRGENFWTISQLYYGSGRFFKALWQANKRTVPAIDRLFVGQSLRIPPPEALDRSLIEPPRPANVSASAPTSGSSAPLRRASSRAEAIPSFNRGNRRAPGELEVALPTSDPFARPGVEASDDSEPVEGPSQRGRPRPILYKVRRHETLRSIARDTLKDYHRAEEIRELNADVISDPNNLPVGQILKLPKDATVGTAPAGSARLTR